ncbi:hypothetical protein B0G81_6627 [Paraburkholderia sp. BL6665CI2N2]|uniref:hypothetical protein n=1 Tax=Paraburkholderia sp. BL6665CI2N2 TaxID=1938806 RepID=UPI00106660E7|nr:hypothetical protein [Paraburkholderia sp. BL6665CI2N2]TDY26122.1 hypothetical protein B0G81_6627 [Paraburkholderia sp. BL6665CI2N2]
MAIARPYKRTCRQLADGSYAGNGNGRYVVHEAYAQAPEHYIRAFQIIQKDLQALFDYVEPSDGNLGCHSYRIPELLLRSCIEVEANCKAILTENGFVLPRSPNMGVYSKVEVSHMLSGYEVAVPTWHGNDARRKPFRNWANADATDRFLPWYQAYNATKHNRATAFEQATFEHMLDAVCAVVILLSAQFHTEDFSNDNTLSAVGQSRDGLETAIGGYFRIGFPTWPDEQRYEFDWHQLQNNGEPFASFPYA